MLAKLHPVQGLPLAVEHSYQYVEGEHKGMTSGVNGQVVGQLILREPMLINDLSPSSLGQWLSPEDPDPNVRETFRLIEATMANEAMSDSDSDITEANVTPIRLTAPVRPDAPIGNRLKRSRTVNFATEIGDNNA